MLLLSLGCKGGNYKAVCPWGQASYFQACNQDISLRSTVPDSTYETTSSSALAYRARRYSWRSIQAQCLRHPSPSFSKPPRDFWGIRQSLDKFHYAWPSKKALGALLSVVNNISLCLLVEMVLRFLPSTETSTFLLKPNSPPPPQPFSVFFFSPIVIGDLTHPFLKGTFVYYQVQSSSPFCQP